jgi:hypothetical protein
LGYHPEKITIHVYQGANEAEHQWNSLKYLLKYDKAMMVSLITT